jgi:hypothetical protein
MQLGFLPISVMNSLKAFGIETDEQLFGFGVILPFFGFWILSQAAYLYLGGSENLEEVSKRYKKPATFALPIRVFYFLVIIALVILFFAQPWLQENFSLPKGSVWVVLAAIQTITGVVSLGSAFIW